MVNHRTMRSLGAGLLGLAAGLAACLCLTSASAWAAPTAHASRTLSITEYANLHLVRKSGSTLYERGTASGTLPGNVSARFQVSVTKVTGSVTIYPRGGGSLTINVVGYPQSAGTVARFKGSMAVRSGTGRYRNAVGNGSFEGTVNRRSWAANVTAKARLTY